MNNTAFSIIVPIYNVDKYILQCLKSIANQSFQDFEVILVNDGSTDETEEIITHYIEDKDKFFLFNKDNEGVSKARNYGLLKATGEYVLFIDPDDWINEYTLENLAKTLKKHGTDILVFGYVREYENRSSRISKPLSVHNETYKILKGSEIEDSIVNKLIGTNVNAIFQEKDFFEKNFFEGFVWRNAYKLSFLKETKIEFPSRINFREDEIFNLIAFIKSSNVGILNQVFYHYRLREKSLSTGFKNKYFETEKQVFNEKKSIILSSEIKNKEIALENLTLKFAYDTIGIVNNICKTDSSYNWKERQQEIKKIINDPFTIKVFKKIDLLSMLPKLISVSNIIKFFVLISLKKRLATPINFIFTLWIRAIYKI